MFVDVGHGRVPVCHRGAVDSFPLVLGLLYGVFAVCCPDCLLNSLNWSVSYVDLCLALRLEPEVLVDLGSPPVNVVEG